MRTVNKVGGANSTVFTEFYGNTTDVKPTEDVPNGSAFYEVDNNMQEYRFDKENKIWYPITRGGTAPSGDYLPLSGGIMTGDINMNGNSLLNAKSIYATDNTDINKVKYISGLLPTNIFIHNYNTVGYNLVGTNISENSFIFYSNDKNNKHSQIEIICNDEDNLPRLSFKAGYNDRINLPVLLKGADTPVENNDIPNKKYVDDSISTLTTTIGDNYIPLAGTTDGKPVSGSIVLGKNGSINSGRIWINYNNITVLPDTETNQYKISLLNGGIRFYRDNKPVAHLRATSANTITFVSPSSDPIKLSNIDIPIGPTYVANKAYVDQETAKYLPLTGTTEDNPVTGVVTFNGESTITGVSTPVNDTDVATKKYADDIKTELDDKTNQLNEDLSDLSSNINAIRFMSKSVKRFTTCCACFEKYLYIFYNNANGSFCDKYDVSIDYIPNLVNTLKLTDENLACSDAKIANDYLYVTLRDGQEGTNTTDGKTLGELHIISLNSFQNVKTLTMNWKCTALTIHKDYLLISMQLAGYDLYDLTNPIEPTLTYSFRPEIGSVEYQECAFFERDNKTYFIDAGFGFGFYIWDVTSKTSPVRVGTFMFSQAWNNGDNLHLHTEGIVIDGNMVYATLSVSEKYIDTEYDKRGIIKFDISNLDVFNYEHMNEIPYEHILINKTDYSPFYGDYDVKPTRIVKVGNALVTNSGAKGLACFKIDKNSVKYNGLISVSDTSLIDRICITSDGRIFGTNTYNTKLSGKDMVMIRLVNVNFN